MKEIFDSIQSRKQKKILLKVRAGAKQSSVDGWIIINDKEYLKLSIKSPPEKGKANKEIIEYLAEELAIPKSDIERVCPSKCVNSL
ncbi:DUF167 N-terminal domain-containing protein [Candidatus Megaera venefica]|uniref:DUF167 N-terminal domain-containing protein n=1 Tax=Candidatus Megaera venefica TaxID=2055910 RepID=A0ABU5NEF2_9RICK|nr:DUF167 family protein [Candidatus Megaera venefica]MEA0971550.1 DUF167 N-terminal domain-containing protein [Candidatus Megaera venefica]